MRILKIGMTTINEDESTAHLTNEELRDRLSADYPEVKNATIRETPDGDNVIVEYVAAPGRKG